MTVDYAHQVVTEQMEKGRKQGRSGWNHPTDCTNERLLLMVANRQKRGDWKSAVTLMLMVQYRMDYGIEP